MAGYRLPRGGTRDRPHAPASLQFRRRAGRRLCRRHRRLGAHRLRAHARRALLQVSSPARHLFGRAGGAERARDARRRRGHRAERQGDDRRGGATGLRVRSQNAWPSLGHRFQRRQRPVRAVLRGGLLLQDLHGPRPRRLDALRALHPPRRGPRQGELRARPGPLRDGARLLRRAGRGRRAGRAFGGACRGPRRRARHPLRGQRRCSAARSTSRTGSADGDPADWLFATQIGA